MPSGTWTSTPIISSTDGVLERASATTGTDGRAASAVAVGAGVAEGRGLGLRPMLPEIGSRVVTGVAFRR